MNEEKTPRLAKQRFHALERLEDARKQGHRVETVTVDLAVAEVAEAVVALQQTVLAHEEQLRSGAAGAGGNGGGKRGMSEERVPTLPQAIANLQDTVLAHEEELKSAAERMAALEDRLRVIAERLESLGRDRYAAEQLTAVHLRVAALEANMPAHLEAIGRLMQRVERLDTLRPAVQLW